MGFITCDPGQWDSLLKASYDAGWLLLEIVDEMHVLADFEKLPQQHHVVPGKGSENVLLG